jgi:hypothetical protein
MSQRFNPNQSASEVIRAVRDVYLMATPDKKDTAYAVLTGAADDFDAMLHALRVARSELNRLGNAVWKDTHTSAFDAVPIAQVLTIVDNAIAKATGKAVTP